jgi:TctA family transporter
MNLKKMFAAAGLVLVAFVVFCFAGEYGTIGDKLLAPLAKLFGADLAGKVLAAVIAIIGWILGRLILKWVPTSMRTIVGKVFWKIMAGLFGDGVLLANHNDPEYLKAELTKKYKIFQIDIKKIGEGK